MSKSATSEVEDVEAQPLLCIAAIVVISTLAAVTAGLPLNLPGNQIYVDATSLDRGDTAWVLLSTIFGIFLSPAIAYLYSNIRNVTSTRIVQLVLLTTSLITFVWVLFTYSLSFGQDVGRFIGKPETFFMFRNTYGQAATQVGAGTVPSAIAAMYELGFALLGPTLIACSLAGRVSTAGFLFFILVWHIAVYCPIAHMMWTHQGWFHDRHTEDFSGGLVVHMLAGLTAFCAHFYLGRDEMPHLPPVLNANETLKSVFLVWFLWFGYTAGKTYNAGPATAQAIMNVFVAPMASALISFFYTLIFEQSITPVSIATALLLGLVGITPAAGYVTVGGAMCIGIATYSVSQTIANVLYLEGLATNAPLSITTVHGLGGTVGFLCTAVFSYKFINPAALNGATWGNGIPILYHTILCVLFFVCATAANFLVLFVSDLIVPLKSSASKEALFPDFSMVVDSTANVPPEVSGAPQRMHSGRMASSGRLGLSRRIEVSLSQRMQYSRSMRSGQVSGMGLGLERGLPSPGHSGMLGGGLGSAPSSPLASPLGGPDGSDRVASIGALAANKSFRGAAMQDLELTQSGQI